MLVGSAPLHHDLVINTGRSFGNMLAADPTTVIVFGSQKRNDHLVIHHWILARAVFVFLPPFFILGVDALTIGQPPETVIFPILNAINLGGYANLRAYNADIFSLFPLLKNGFTTHSIFPVQES